MADSNEEETSEIPKLPLIFPPKNHENLHISLHTHSFSLPSLTATSPSSSSSTFSIATSDDTSPPSSPIKNFNNSDITPNSGSWGCWGLWDSGLGLLYGKFDGFGKFLRSFGFVRGVFSILRSRVGWLLVFLYFRWRRRVGGGLGDGGNQHLLRVIREKDERIKELLTQIARMNEVLLSMHKVPSSNGG